MNQKANKEHSANEGGQRTSEQVFETWAIVEIFGHQVMRIKNIRAGKVSEQTIGGKGMLRIDVPQSKERSSFTKFYGMDGDKEHRLVYCITPVEEHTAIAAAEQFSSRPYDGGQRTSVLRLRLPEVTSRNLEGKEWNDDDEY
jgi:hypothetical protein